MKQTSTLVGRLSIMLTLLFTLSTNHSSGQTSPSLKFSKPMLFSGVAGEKNAVYKFTNVINGVDAFIKIKKIQNGAILRNIDDSTFGYYDAWQPIVGGPSLNGSDSHIRWEITFKTTAGSSYNFPVMDLSAVDIDGDNVKVKEYVRVKHHSSHAVPTYTLMTMSVVPSDDDDDDDDDGKIYGRDDDDDDDNLQGVGPIVNRLNIDTLAGDVRVSYQFLNKNKVEITTGSIVENNSYTGPIASDRMNSLYFKYILPAPTVLPVNYRSLRAVATNKNVNLYWITDSEIGNDHFEIERGHDQLSFQKIGTLVNAQAIKGTEKHYNFKDQSLELKGRNFLYYRLKQVDKDGKFSYSEIKMVRFLIETNAFVEVFPNPVTNKATIGFVSEQSGKAEIRVINMSGQLISSMQQDVNLGYNSIQMNSVSTLSTGMYMVEVIAEGKLLGKQKIVKQ